ncbi:N-acyl homoserine lactonase family protein [Paraburkholderia sediminicola]|uniref:N-acyl homoserine lactonase family protein n=1 Tax=Paraburkholderia sediminicola TaxID=458836 RepID=UPI0038BC1171
MNETPTFELYAIRYASIDRPTRDNFLSAVDIHEGSMAMDFYVWLIRSKEECILVDTGFSESSSRKRGRRFVQRPEHTLEQLGVAPLSIRHLILTHLHYDHAGATSHYPNAKIHLQDAEMQYATGRCMCHKSLNHFFAVEDVQAVVGSVFSGNVRFHDGAAEIVPGVEVVRVGGHTPGLQVVRVHTGRGWVILASDAAHYYVNMDLQNPFPAVHNTAEMMEGFDLLSRWAESPDHIVPGHDPQVAGRYQAVPSTEAYKLHEPPRTSAG